jgi:hypothetical protein
MERSQEQDLISLIPSSTPITPAIPTMPELLPATPVVELPQELKSGLFDEGKDTRLFFEAISEVTKNPSKIKKIYDQRSSLTEQLSFDDLLKIVQYAKDYRLELELRLTEQLKSNGPVKVIQESKLPRRIAICRDSHNQIALIIFLENLMAEGGVDPNLTKTGQTKQGNYCYAITLHDELDLLELYFVKSSQKERLTAGYKLATALNSPYILKYLLIEYSDTELGLLSARGLFRLDVMERYQQLFQYHDLITICYSLFSAVRDLHREITHRDLIANWMLFKENDIYYVKMIDFDYSIQSKEIFEYHKDLKDVGHVITARVLYDTNSLLDTCPSELYWQVICDIQDLARALVICTKQAKKQLITAEMAFAKFVEIIQPVLQADPSLNAKIGYMQKFLEKSSSGGSLRVESRAGVANFCLADSEKIIPLSVLLQRSKSPEVKEIRLQGELKLRRDMDKDQPLEMSLLKNIKPTADLGGIWPLALAIYKKNWQLAIQLMDYFITQKFPLSSQLTLMSFKSFPDYDCGLLSLVIDESGIKETLRQELVTKLLDLGANRFYQSSIMGSPLISIVKALEGFSRFPERSSPDEKKSIWTIINILYPDAIFVDPAASGSFTLENISTIKRLLVLAISQQNDKVIAGLMRCLNSKDYEIDFLVPILNLAIKTNSLRKIRYLLITLTTPISNSQFIQIMCASMFCNVGNVSLAGYTLHTTKTIFRDEKSSQNSIRELWKKAITEKDEAWSVFLLNNINLSDRAVNLELLTFFSKHGDHFCTEHVEKSLSLLFHHLNFPALSPLSSPFLTGKQRWSVMKVLLKTKKVTLDHKFHGQTLFELCVRNSKWDCITDAAPAIDIYPSLRKCLIKRKQLSENALYWAVCDNNAKAVKVLCENKFSVDEIRKVTMKNGKILNRASYLTLAIKNLPESFEVVKVLLTYSNVEKFNFNFYNHNHPKHAKSKYISKLMCFLIQREEIEIIKQFILDRSFNPTFRVFDDDKFRNFIKFAVDNKKWEVFNLFKQEIKNIEEFCDEKDFPQETISLETKSIMVGTQRVEQKESTDHSGDDDKHLSCCFPHLTTEFVDGIADFESRLKSKELSAQSYVCYNPTTQKRWLRLIDYMARRERWEFVRQLLLHGADYDFRMTFQKEDGSQDQCSFFHFILKKSHKDKVVRRIIFWLLKRSDLDVLSPSNSETVLSGIDYLIEKDSKRSKTYLKFKNQIESLMAEQRPINAIPDSKTSQLEDSKSFRYRPLTLFSAPQPDSKRKMSFVSKPKIEISTKSLVNHKNEIAEIFSKILLKEMSNTIRAYIQGKKTTILEAKTIAELNEGLVDFFDYFKQDRPQFTEITTSLKTYSAKLDVAVRDVAVSDSDEHNTQNSLSILRKPSSRRTGLFGGPRDVVKRKTRQSELPPAKKTSLRVIAEPSSENSNHHLKKYQDTIYNMFHEMKDEDMPPTMRTHIQDGYAKILKSGTLTKLRQCLVDFFDYNKEKRAQFSKMTSALKTYSIELEEMAGECEDIETETCSM